MTPIPVVQIYQSVLFFSTSFQQFPKEDKFEFSFENIQHVYFFVCKEL